MLFFFQQSLFFFDPFSIGSRCRRRWPSAAAGKESELEREVTQEELVERDTPPGALRRACLQCGGLVGPDVPLLRQRCGCAGPSRRGVQTADVDGAALGLCPLRGCSDSEVSRRLPGATVRLRRDRAAPAGFRRRCDRPDGGQASGLRSELNDLGSLSLCFQPCKSPT